MKKTENHWRMAFIASAIIFCVGLIASSSNTAGQVHKQANQSKYQQPAKKITDTMVVIGGGWIDRNKDLISAISTLFVAFFTGTLWWSTNKQAKLTRAAIELAQGEFNATHRPKIRIRYITGEPLVLDKIPTATIHAANIGETEAVCEQIGVDMFVRRRGRLTTDYDATPRSWPGNTGSIIASGKEAVIVTQSTHGLLSANEIENIKSRYNELCLLGIIIYKDKAGIQRSTSFFRVLNVHSERFWRVEETDPYVEWEYED